MAPNEKPPAGGIRTAASENRSWLNGPDTSPLSHDAQILLARMRAAVARLRCLELDATEVAVTLAYVVAEHAFKVGVRR
jgi:hypothetical protein